VPELLAILYYSAGRPAEPSGVLELLMDLGSRGRDVVLVRRTISSGKHRGVGNLEWGGDGEREISSKATWGQGGQDRIMSKEGFQVSKREMEEGVTKNQQGEQKGELRHNYIVNLCICI
jgi:hypothetical protein